MAVITFWGNSKIETTQTTSMAGIATYLSLEQNYRILLINAKYNDTSLQECFWGQAGIQKVKTDLETGISGLMKSISSNKFSPEIITNYTRTIFKDRLELLTDSNIPKEDYEKQKKNMIAIIKMANKFYDLIFIDIEGDFVDPSIQNILQESDLIIVNTTQRMKYIKEFQELRKLYNFGSKNNIIYLLGKYDRFSKYNIKNIQREGKIQEVYAIPYNTLFFEACNEGNMVDFIINFRRKRNGIQGPIIESIATLSKRIIDKLKELQMQSQ